MEPSISHHDQLVEYLKDPQAASDYLNLALEENDTVQFLVALRNVAEAHGGLLKLSQKVKMHRGNLYRMLSEKGNPEIHSVYRILNSYGLSLVVKVQSKKKAA